MAEVTEPILLDSTGKDIASKLDDIKSAIENGGGSPESGSFTVTVKDEGNAGKTVTLTGGTEPQTATLSELGTANFTVTEPGTYTATVNGNSIGSADVGKYLIENDAIYGFIEHMGTLAPGQRIEYIGANIDYDPIRITMGGGYDLGDWANYHWLKKNRPYMVKKNGVADYELDPDDYTKRKDGTASDISSSSYSGAGAFSWAERIYKRETVSGTDRKVEFCFSPREGFKPIGFKDKDGNVLNGRWIPMFYASLNSGAAKTVSGVAPQANQTTDAQVAAVQAVGTRANFLGGPFVETLIDLMIMFAKTTDLQGFYGYGACNGYATWSTTVPAQTVVGGGQFYGTSDKKSYNKIFHSVVLGSSMVWCRDPYEVVVSGRLKVSKDYHIDLTGATYDDTGLTYSTTSAWQYPDKYSLVDGYGSVPVQPCGGTTATGGCDGLYVNAGITAVCLRFGNCNDDFTDGPRARSWYNAASFSNWYLGFAVLLDPPVGESPQDEAA